MLETWDLWMPSAGATGLSFARSRVDAQAAGDRLLVHAATRTGPWLPRARTWSAANRAR